MIDCVRFLGMTDIREIGRLTAYEFDLLREGVRLRQMDQDREMHWQAFLNRQIGATRLKNKKESYVYRTFEDFYKERSQAPKLIIEAEARSLLLAANQTRKEDENGGELFG